MDLDGVAMDLTDAVDHEAMDLQGGAEAMGQRSYACDCRCHGSKVQCTDGSLD